MAGNTHCIFPSGLWETSTCQAFPIPPDVSAWQYDTTNYTDPSLGLELPSSLERIFLGRAQTFSLLMSAAHLLFFYRAFTAFIAKYSLFYPYLEPDMSFNQISSTLNLMPSFQPCVIAASVIPRSSSLGFFHVQIMFFYFIYTLFYPGWIIWLVHISCSLSLSLRSVCCGSDNNFGGQTNKLCQISATCGQWPVVFLTRPQTGSHS